MTITNSDTKASPTVKTAQGWELFDTATFSGIRPGALDEATTVTFKLRIQDGRGSWTSHEIDFGDGSSKLFAGRMAAVDAALEALRRLVFVRGAEDLGAIRLVKCDARSRLRNPELRGQIVAEILGAAARLAA